ncbi:hypothetical protein EVAR_21045_1 [Eumeta japonica]|uniref:Uncharacterized protein n=1 Tax=Eumeta variegata TaxID=151549 RepID=A0A4C1V178_EUMVA|nr:hypothetical protein EVAR_21045_1 [Eumeta japonica]
MRVPVTQFPPSLHYLSINSPSVRYSIPTQEAGNVLVTSLVLQMSMGGCDYLFSDGSSVRLLLEYAIKKSSSAGLTLFTRSLCGGHAREAGADAARAAGAAGRGRPRRWMCSGARELFNIGCRDERKFRVVLRGVPKEFSIKKVKEDLLVQNLAVQRCTRSQSSPENPWI